MAGTSRRWLLAIAVVSAVLGLIVWAAVTPSGATWAERLGGIATVIAAVPILVTGASWLHRLLSDKRPRELLSAAGFLGDAPRLGAQMVARPDVTVCAVKALLGPGCRAVALVGMGGAGKSAVAATVVLDRRLRRRFKRVTWLSAGPDTDPPALLARMARRLGAERPAYTNVGEGRDELAALLAGQRLLIVLDKSGPVPRWTRSLS